MKPATKDFERAMRQAFPADAQRDDVRVLCRAMFDAGRRSARNEYRRLKTALLNERKERKP